MKGYCRHDEVLRALGQSLIDRGRMPTMKELCGDLGMKRGTAYVIFARLVELGKLRTFPIGTLRYELLDENSRVNPSPASAEREKAAPVRDSSAGAAAFGEASP